MLSTPSLLSPQAEFKSKITLVLMLLIYTLTTPIGVAIGVSVNETYNENSSSTLMLTGILDSISAGILIYDSLANILMEHFASDTFRRGKMSFKLVQFFALWLGAAAMAIVGKYA